MHVYLSVRVHALNASIRAVGTYIIRTYTQLDALIRFYMHINTYRENQNFDIGFQSLKKTVNLLYSKWAFTRRSSTGILFQKLVSTFAKSFLLILINVGICPIGIRTPYQPALYHVLILDVKY